MQENPEYGVCVSGVSSFTVWGTESLRARVWFAGRKLQQLFWLTLRVAQLQDGSKPMCQANRKAAEKRVEAVRAIS